MHVPIRIKDAIVIGKQQMLSTGYECSVNANIPCPRRAAIFVENNVLYEVMVRVELQRTRVVNEEYLVKGFAL